MDSDALKTFLTVHRRGGVSNAARALHRSQPAISRRIALLEQELGMPLFERVVGRTKLSDAGRVMVPYAERAVAAAQDAENAVRALTRQNAGPVSLAVVGTLAGGQLSVILKRFAREYPDANLTLRTATSAEVSDLIRRAKRRSACATIWTACVTSTTRVSPANRCRSSAPPTIPWPASA